MVALTVDKLLQQFINLRQTGKDIPGCYNFIIHSRVEFGKVNLLHFLHLHFLFHKRKLFLCNNNFRKIIPFFCNSFQCFSIN